MLNAGLKLFFLESFYTGSSKLEQRDSCLLLCLALDKAVKDSGLNTRDSILQKSIHILAFFDGFDIVRQNKQSYVEVFISSEAAAKMVLTINEDKITNRPESNVVFENVDIC